MVATQNLVIYQGSDFSKVLEFRNESSVLMNLTGYTFAGKIKNKYSDEIATLSFTFTLRNQTLTPGLVDCQILAATSTLLALTKAGDYLYDMEFTDSLGGVRRFLEGKVKIYPEVTR